MVMTIEWAVLELKKRGYIVSLEEGEINGGTRWTTEDDMELLDDEFWISWAGSGDGWCSVVDGDRELHPALEKAVDRVIRLVRPRQRGVFSA